MFPRRSSGTNRPLPFSFTPSDSRLSFSNRRGRGQKLDFQSFTSCRDKSRDKAIGGFAMEHDATRARIDANPLSSPSNLTQSRAEPREYCEPSRAEPATAFLSKAFAFKDGKSTFYSRVSVAFGTTTCYS
ncbi:hypothetical protein PUN28_016413 [Cardiocondyla obscurior]|uniref:Uncharacterized protein n=1 Tax=Cardiocondyla obscurior TaxID=286306 RepID=A0AAW2ENP7_9HYME